MQFSIRPPFSNEREAFWNQVVRGKYEEEQGGWFTKIVKDCYGVGVWKTIRKEWNIVAGRMSFAVGNRRRVPFWKCCGTVPLSVAFPSLYAIATSKDALVTNVWSPGEVQHHWQSKVQLRVCFFAWEAAWGKVLKLGQLQKRGRSWANMCFLCQRNEETIYHILLHCVKTRVLWELLLSLFGVAWVFPSLVRHALEGWRRDFCRQEKEECLEGWAFMHASFGLCGR